MISWDDSFCTGIDIIDKQHKTLFALGRELELLLQIPDGVNKKDDALKLLGDFRNYVTYHFYTEERFMEDKNYDNIENHKKYHNNFKKKITNISAKNIVNENYDEMRTLLNNLYSWIFDHVSSEDMCLKKYADKNN